MASLHALIPDFKVLLSLEPEELAGALLEHFLSMPANERWTLNPHNFFDTSMGPADAYPKDVRDQVNDALREAWAWLVREGLLVPKGSDGWYTISRRGQKMTKRADVDAYRHANLLPRGQLHPTIAQKVWTTFLRGDYDTAVFQSFKEVEIAVRAAGGFGDDAIGTVLMRDAFNVKNGPLTDASREKSEQEAMGHFFAGAYGLYRNPTGHRHVALKDPVEAVEMIVIASHLLRIVDGRVQARGRTP